MYRRKKISENTTLQVRNSYKSKFKNSKPKNNFKNNKNSHLGIPFPKKTSGTIKIHILEFQSKKDFKNSNSHKNRITLKNIHLPNYYFWRNCCCWKTDFVMQLSFLCKPPHSLECI
jgi:hypothetical protein